MRDNSRQRTRLLDQQFGVWVSRHFSAHLAEDSDKKMLKQLAEAVSYATGLKHSCLDLRTCKSLGDPVLDVLLKMITPPRVVQLLAEKVTPLVCSGDGEKIWLQKYHAFEQGVAQQLIMRSRDKSVLSKQQQTDLAALFGKDSQEHLAAAQKALTHNLAIITGGPGTGKTWTVARIIVLLLQANPDCRIQLAAPTGKAGARMKESITRAFSDDVVMQKHSNLLNKLPQKASTLDGLLGINSRQSPKPRKQPSDPLACDVLIVDEASMIALPMMYRLLRALPASAKLILLGDKDQLASVEAGSVLGDICVAGGLLQQSESIATISTSRRYQHSPEIGVLATALNSGTVPDLSANTQVVRHTLPAESVWNPPWLAQATQQFAAMADDLSKKTQFQILCALRDGPQGVSGINRIVAEALGHKPDDWYAGRPVMVTQNDHDRRLYNGDVGMVLLCENPETGWRELKACFLVDGAIKQISRAQMPAFETCYAMTVHKSQGSEYSHVCIVLPADAENLGPVLTRELVYTAVTRAKDRVDLWCGEGVLEEAAKKTIERMSGLQYFLNTTQSQPAL